MHRFLLNCHASRSLQTSANLCKIFEVPSRREVEYLKELYPNPKCLIHDLLQPLVHSGVTVTPQVVVTPRLGGRFFRAKLQLHWPSKVTVSAVDSSVAGAEKNAYLLACDLLKNMGLLYQLTSGSMMPISQDYILKILHTLHSSYCHPFSLSQPEFTFTTTPTHHTPSSQNALFMDDGLMGLKTGTWPKQLWRTKVAASWPYCFDIISLGPSCDVSKYVAALHTSIKLKALGLLSSTNHLVLSRLPVISSQQKAAAAMSAQHFDPHYEIYSDASALGFGAYLMKKDDNRIHWLANAWSEHFPDCPRINTRQQAKATAGSSVYLESTFCELYAVVTACFTWKHKFVEKRILVWTDSQAVVNMLNWGLHGESKVNRWGKLLTILVDTCQKYSIKLQARHIHRSENIAADLLSRCQLSAFREAVPDAAPSQKKTKKLLFWNPLQTGKGHGSEPQNKLI